MSNTKGKVISEGFEKRMKDKCEEGLALLIEWDSMDKKLLSLRQLGVAYARVSSKTPKEDEVWTLIEMRADTFEKRIKIWAETLPETPKETRALKFVAEIAKTPEEHKWVERKYKEHLSEKPKNSVFWGRLQERIRGSRTKIIA